MSNEGAGERIEQLLASFSASGQLEQERAAELVRLVSQLHAVGLERLLEVIDEAEALTDGLLERFAEDDLVSGLLLLHGLHPYDLNERIERALEKVRPYLGSHGGDVRFLGVTEEAVVRLELLGNCQGCPSSAVTLKLAVQTAIEEAAPEVESISCDESTSGRQQGSSDGTVIAAESLMQRARARDEPNAAVWEQLELTELASGEIRLISVAEVDIVVCRVGETRYAYRDACAGCAGSLRAASLQRAPAGAGGSAVLVCPHCRAHYDVRSAGASLDGAQRHLEPLPLLERDGVLEVAVPAAVSA